MPRACFPLLALGLCACTARPDVVALERDEATAGAAGTISVAGGGGHVGGGGGAGGTHSEGGSTTGGSSNPVVEPLELTGDLETHDSCMIEAEGRYTLFHTGPGISTKVSDNLRHWEIHDSVFDENPPWIAESVPDATVLWAPDVSWFGGAYHLYFAASTFGSGRSCIGHATKNQLGAPSAWVDRGPIICSDSGTVDDDWDAIDPSTFEDADGARWMVFGSFGSGIKLIRLNEQGERADEELHSIAARPVEVAIQAPYIRHHAPYYYLFVSFDQCCQGVSSTYNIRVGRASNVLGPYTDREGVDMLQGGGSLLLEGNERWRGVGANTVIFTQGQDFNVYHSYDANAAGRATLRISPLTWDADGWPRSTGP